MPALVPTLCWVGCVRNRTLRGSECQRAPTATTTWGQPPSAVRSSAARLAFCQRPIKLAHCHPERNSPIRLRMGEWSRRTPSILTHSGEKDFEIMRPRLVPPIGVLRLRSCFAKRSSHSAQEDNTCRIKVLTGTAAWAIFLAMSFLSHLHHHHHVHNVLAGVS